MIFLNFNDDLFLGCFKNKNSSYLGKRNLIINDLKKKDIKILPISSKIISEFQLKLKKKNLKNESI